VRLDIPCYVVGDAKQARRAIDATAEAGEAVLAVHNARSEHANGATQMAGMLAGADGAQLAALIRYGPELGMAFQIVDAEETCVRSLCTRVKRKIKSVSPHRWRPRCRYSLIVRA